MRQEGVMALLLFPTQQKADGAKKSIGRICKDSWPEKLETNDTSGFVYLGAKGANFKMQVRTFGFAQTINARSVM